MSYLAELFVHRQFERIDSTAHHRGGNYAVRDHELFENSVWVNTKSGWFDREDRLGFSPVNWDTARDPKKPHQSLDLVAVVPLRPENVRATASADGVHFAWEPVEWYLFPASQLKSAMKRETAARASVDLAFAASYQFESGEELMMKRFAEILASNEPLEVAPAYRL